MDFRKISLKKLRFAKNRVSYYAQKFDDTGDEQWADKMKVWAARRDELEAQLEASRGE